jgi:hypothetical protein
MGGGWNPRGGWGEVGTPEGTGVTHTGWLNSTTPGPIQPTSHSIISMPDYDSIAPMYISIRK